MFEELHCTAASCCVLLSLNVPTAAKLSVLPTVIEGLAGITEIDTNPSGVRVLGG